MSKRICVLEDNEDIREIISFILEEEDYEVSVYANIKDFINREKNLKTDVFLLDVMLPDGNGLDVCNILKADYSTKEIPVMMMSANYKKVDIQKACKAEDFISKPFDIVNLLSKIGVYANA